MKANLPTDWLKQIQSVYPYRKNGQGWGYVKKRIPELIGEGHTFDDILSSAKSYGNMCRATNEQYVRMARTFFGQEEWWLETYDLPTRKPRVVEEVTEQQREAAILQFKATVRKYEK